MTSPFYGQRLRTVRNFYGYSLEEVGHFVAATKQYIQQLESGAKQPTEEMCSALAEIFDVKDNFFYVPESSPVGEEDCHFRRIQTTPLGIRNQAIAHGTLFAELIDGLDKNLKLPRVNFPNINPLNMADIERVAEACRMHWGLGVTGPIKNMVRVAENAGAIITYFSNVSEKIDAFSLHKKRPLIIRNPFKESACRMRFDIAHECGHLVMHHGVRTGDKGTEDQANRFASAFLLPRVAFLKEFPRTPRLSWAAIYDLKIRWKVAASAIVRRAYDLNIIDAAQYRTANVHLRKTGEAKCERYDVGANAIATEHPELIHTAIAALIKSEKIVNIFSSLRVKQGLIEKLINQKLDFKSENIKSKENSINVVDISKYKK